MPAARVSGLFCAGQLSIVQLTTWQAGPECCQFGLNSFSQCRTVRVMLAEVCSAEDLARGMAWQGVAWVSSVLLHPSAWLPHRLLQ